MSRARLVRAGSTLVVTGLCTAYIVWKIDLGRTGHLLAHARVGWWLLACAIMAGSVWPLAWRWRELLAARGVRERLPWLIRTSFVAYAAGQVLPTSLGGDATRIYETSRRHRGSGAAAAATVILERGLGGATTLVLAAVGFAIAVGRYSVGGYLWLELALVVGTVVGAVVLFSTRLHPLLHRVRPLLRAVRLERPLREVYVALHSFRGDRGVLAGMFS
ncbi:MAG: flippase-like domain-containing protein, partial [Actinobacteria bacterium]|nr:flippase-like domain-containing protein [Actinomycetota bacterium]